MCDENYFGNPEVPGGMCRQCACNNNVDIAKAGNCDPHTGKCLQCLFNTEGDNCEVCKTGLFGDAIHQTCRGIVNIVKFSHNIVCKKWFVVLNVNCDFYLLFRMCVWLFGITI